MIFWDQFKKTRCCWFCGFIRMLSSSKQITNIYVILHKILFLFSTRISLIVRWGRIGETSPRWSPTTSGQLLHNETHQPQPAACDGGSQSKSSLMTITERHTNRKMYFVISVLNYNRILLCTWYMKISVYVTHVKPFYVMTGNYLHCFKNK